MLNENDIEVVDRQPGVVVGEVRGKHKLLRHLKQDELVVLADGLDSLLTFVQDKMPHAKQSKSSERTRDPWDDSDFNAFDTYQEALDTFKHHPEKVVTFDASELRIKDESESGSVVDYDVVGDYIDMGRFMEGVPESWGSMHNGNARNRRVNIMVDVSQWWGISHSDVTHRGERILRLVDALEAGGVRTELTAIESSGCTHTEVILKRHDEPLTISDLAVVTHPEYLRRILFRVIEHSKTFYSGYGHASDLEDSINRNPHMLHSGNNDEINIFIAGNMQGISSIDSNFDKMERLIVWEMNKPVPEVDAIKLDRRGIYFNANGTRSEEEIRKEGQEAINND